MKVVVNISMVALIVAVCILIVAISRDIHFQKPVSDIQAITEHIDAELEYKQDYIGCYGVEVSENEYTLTYMFLGHNEYVTIVIDESNNITCYGSELLCDYVNSYINRYVS